MRNFDTSGLGLNDISDIINAVLNQRGDQLTLQQRQELRERQNRIDQARRQNDSAALQQFDQGKEGLLDDIIRIAGPIVAGYILRMIQERVTGGGREAGTTPSGYQERPPQYGTYREGDAVHRSGPGGQSVQEVD
ncbi:MAG: hypothetical protein M5U01_11420 [Ardenticatenaceae bacterium]|nr:hypothetical protein [Ardenticatenaceae bacterium]